jgi:hypothetical protein
MRLSKNSSGFGRLRHVLFALRALALTVALTRRSAPVVFPLGPPRDGEIASFARLASTSGRRALDYYCARPRADEEFLDSLR